MRNGAIMGEGSRRTTRGSKKGFFFPSIPVCGYQQELKCFELYNGKRENEDVIKL